MIYIPAFILILVRMLVTTVLAAPANEKRTVGGVQLCTDLHWGGTCGHRVQPLNTCVVLGPDWDNKVSSFGPDPCTLCFAYSNADCSNPEWVFTFPGDATGGLLSVMGPPFNDKISSFKCQDTC